MAKGGKLKANKLAQMPPSAGAKTKAAIRSMPGSTGGSIGNTWHSSPGKHANVKGGTAAGSA